MKVRTLEVEDGPYLRARAQTYAATMFPELIPDIEKIHWLIRDLTRSGNTQYARVVGPLGEPKAALLTRTENNVWALKKHAAVMLWYSDIPGVGAQLLRGFRDWVKENPQIVIAGFNADWVSNDSRPMRLAERIGFERRGEGGYMLFPRRKKR